ncbi:unnamed protein product [Mytilus coruscus]|uniref:Reverse transcriptase RNase H-like domain-containing protein n=1 Tax=Mytilus coruscus TaxID=42192 RepID=A0A6J8CUL1_MYTCO|nr:unnamed protein product [Mytilus coruscus]
MSNFFERFRQANLKLKPKKCPLVQHQVLFLGHSITDRSIACGPSKIEAVRDWPTPKYINEKLIRLFKNTDASGHGIGTVHSQIQDGEEKVFAYASEILIDTQRKYCTTYRVKECSVCARAKRSPGLCRYPLHQSQVGFPLDRIGIDIVGPCPITKNGNEYIIVVSDYFTKWCEAYAELNHNAPTFAAKDILSKAATRQKNTFDRGIKSRNYEVGDSVWRWYPSTAGIELASVLQCPSCIKLTHSVMEMREHLVKYHKYTSLAVKRAADGMTRRSIINCKYRSPGLVLTAVKEKVEDFVGFVEVGENIHRDMDSEPIERNGELVLVVKEIKISVCEEQFV